MLHRKATHRGRKGTITRVFSALEKELSKHMIGDLELELAESGQTIRAFACDVEMVAEDEDVGPEDSDLVLDKKGLVSEVDRVREKLDERRLDRDNLQKELAACLLAIKRLEGQLKDARSMESRGRDKFRKKRKGK